VHPRVPFAESRHKRIWPRKLLKAGADDLRKFRTCGFCRIGLLHWNIGIVGTVPQFLLLEETINIHIPGREVWTSQLCWCFRSGITLQAELRLTGEDAEAWAKRSAKSVMTTSRFLPVCHGG
jgi:hypothetical protein